MNIINSDSIYVLLLNITKMSPSKIFPIDTNDCKNSCSDYCCGICLGESLTIDQMVFLCPTSDKHAVCTICFDGMRERTPIQMRCPTCRALVKPDLLQSPQSVIQLPVRFPDAYPVNGVHTLYYFYFDGVSVMDYEGNVIDLGLNSTTTQERIDEIRLHYNNPRMMSNYRNGAKNGLTTVFGIHGDVRERIEYKHNRVHGTYKVYENGQIIEMSEYVDGELHGPSTIYYTDYDRSVPRSNGLPPVEMVIQYVNGRQTGDIYTYYENGNVEEVFPNEGATITDGFNGTYKCFYSNGKIKIEIGYEDNTPHAPYKIYSRSGAILESGTFHHGVIQGEVYSKLTETVDMIRQASHDLTDTPPVTATMANPDLYIRRVVASNSGKRHCVSIHDIHPSASIRGIVSGPEQIFTSVEVTLNPEGERKVTEVFRPRFQHGICISTR